MLGTVVAVARTLWCLARGAVSTARRVAVRWALGALAYFAVVLAVSLAQEGRVVPLGVDECFDDWCIAVTAAARQEARVVVSMRVSNRGRGRTQAEPDAYVYLRDAGGRAISSSATAPMAAALGDPVSAGQSHIVEARFHVPDSAGDCVLVKARRARFPGIVIIGDPSSVLHRPTVHALR